MDCKLKYGKTLREIYFYVEYLCECGRSHRIQMARKQIAKSFDVFNGERASCGRAVPIEAIDIMKSATVGNSEVIS